MVHDLLCLKATMYSIFVSSLAYSLTTLKPLQKKKKRKRKKENRLQKVAESDHSNYLQQRIVRQFFLHTEASTKHAG